MIDKEKIRNDIKEILIKLEETNFLLKDGKQILAFNKINGVKQKLGILYRVFEENHEKNKDA
ncbi:hypothetical protein LCGC14_1521920 [marine sediment metagenome]|uniref:Uncharacterized protein n=1 Tax=marine sediment metagenome TaxID=412755 RepID=A0A0F9JJA7_9ZZZZ